MMPLILIHILLRERFLVKTIIKPKTGIDNPMALEQLTIDKLQTKNLYNQTDELYTNRLIST